MPVDQNGRMQEGELLEAVRRLTGAPAVAYAEPPVLLTGGFFTENHAFRLSGVSGEWAGPLVVRLFPVTVDDEVVRCEVEMQRGVAAQGYPAPLVVHFDIDERLDGRRFLVMERIPGHTLLGGITVGTMLRQAPTLLRSLSRTTAALQARLHGLDAAPVIAALDGTPHTIDRWFVLLEREVGMSAPGFAGGVRWLRDNRPPPPTRPVICHGDLWPGNILVNGSEVTGVIDWTVATVAEPALDVGFTTMAFDIVPVDTPGWLRGLTRRVGSSLSRRYVTAYRDLAPDADLSRQPYYQAMRCATELTGVTRYRTMPKSNGRPTWDAVADEMVDYFKERTGVELTLPRSADAARPRG